MLRYIATTLPNHMTDTVYCENCGTLQPAEPTEKPVYGTIPDEYSGFVTGAEFNGYICRVCGERADRATLPADTLWSILEMLTQNRLDALHYMKTRGLSRVTPPPEAPLRPEILNQPPAK